MSMSTLARFERAGQRNRFTARRATVIAVRRPADGVVRVTLGGPDFRDFESTGPADHVRLFFPDPATGILTAPVPSPDGDGIVRPDGPTINRDYTPIGIRQTGDGWTVDVDFMEHPDAGPATLWALATEPGDELVAVGPRGSKRAPQDLDGFLAIVDSTALPSLSRWLADIPAGTPVTVVAALDHDETWLRSYLSPALDDASVSVVGTAVDDLVAGVSALAAVGTGTFVFAAGEARALAAVRRHLATDRGLPPEQVAISGYWRRGVVAFDHHGPLED
jgi:NADPH-dependent ferric siderophore reductase